MNNRQLHDGRDPDSCGNIARALGLWDRAREERHIYGGARTMTAAGLERKAHQETHVSGVEELTRPEVRR